MKTPLQVFISVCFLTSSDYAYGIRQMVLNWECPNGIS